MKFYSTLLLAEDKMMKKKNGIHAPSHWVVISSMIYMQNLNNTQFFLPVVE